MKPLYWKFFLILGAVLVAASLVLPKALRKNAHDLQNGSVYSEAQIADSQEATDVSAKASQVTVFTFHEVVQVAPETLQLCVKETKCPLGQRAYSNKDGSKHMMLKATAFLNSGIDLESVSARLHPASNVPVLNFALNDAGKNKLCTLTTDHIGEQFAIVLSGEILTAPLINSGICGGRGFLEGGFSQIEASELARQLNAGMRPVKSRVVD